MKRLFAILAVVAGLGLGGCTFDTQIYTKDYIITPADWKLSEGSVLDSYLYASFRNESITRGVINNGNVSVSVFIPNEGTWTPLPYVFPFEYQVVDERTGQPSGATNIIPEVIRFDWAEGEITFIIQDLDGGIPYAVSGDLTFRVSIFR